MNKQLLVAASLLATATFNVNSKENTNNEISSTVDLNFRYRVEMVDMDTFNKQALASTARTRATLKTLWNSNWDSTIEFDNVTEVGSDNFNAGAGNTPDKGQYPVVADPAGTEINQAYIRFNGESTKLAYGRQRILVGNQRFIGGVGWRQNEQTFDGFTAKSNLNDKLNLNYAYIFNVNRIFGEAVDSGDNEHDTHILDAEYKLGFGTLKSYYFSINNQSTPVASSNTFGIRYTGTLNNFTYTAELATQSDLDNNPNNYSANYYLLESFFKKANYSVGAGYEVLGGDIEGGGSFVTPLATLHKFQGWADAFIGRSDDLQTSGVKDIYMSAFYETKGYKFNVVYHEFLTEQGNTDLGSEIDFAVSKQFTKQLSGLFKYASFDSDSQMLSRDKIWVMLTYKP